MAASLAARSGLAWYQRNVCIRCFVCSATRPLRSARDAYAVMGLERSATADDVKARFRELAKKYHPDLNADRSSSLKMAELTGAYDTLMDPRKRSALDQAAAAPNAGASSSQAGFGYTGNFGKGPSEEWVNPSQMFSEFQDVFGRNTSQRPMGPSVTAVRGDDISCQIEVSFLDAMRGCEQVVSLMVRQSCTDCRGSGAREGTAWSTCRVCRGTGVQRVERGILSMGVPCHRCQGTGEVLDHPCRACRGEGARLLPRDARVNVPAGVRNLMELRVPGAGHAGSRGGKPGHLFVTVKVLADERFRHIDDDVHIDLPLSLRQALLGGELEIPTLTGSSETLAVKAGTQPGATRVLRGRGPPRLGGEGRGHMILHFMLRLPEVLSSRQVELIEEFDVLTSKESQARYGAKTDGTEREQTRSAWSREQAPPKGRARPQARART